MNKEEEVIELDSLDINSDVKEKTNSFYSSNGRVYSSKKETIESCYNKLQKVSNNGLIKSNNTELTLYSGCNDLVKTEPKDDIYFVIAELMVRISELSKDLNVISEFCQYFEMLYNMITMNYCLQIDKYVKEENFSALESISSKLLENDIKPFLDNIFKIEKVKELIDMDRSILYTANVICKEVISDFNKYKPSNFLFDQNEGAPIYNQVQQEWEYRMNRIGKIKKLYIDKAMCDDSGGSFLNLLTFFSNPEDEMIKKKYLNDKCSNLLEDAKKTQYVSLNTMATLGYDTTVLEEELDKEVVDSVKKRQTQIYKDKAKNLKCITSHGDEVKEIEI